MVAIFGHDMREARPMKKTSKSLFEKSKVEVSRSELQQFIKVNEQRRDEDNPEFRDFQTGPRVFLAAIRHPPIINSQNLCYGRTDMPLVQNWRDSLQTLRDNIKDLHFDKVICSPAERCRTLLKALELKHLPTNFDKRLLEINFGSWEGKAWTTIDRLSVDRWIARPQDFCEHGGETFNQLCSRVYELAKEESDNRTLLITHSGVLKALSKIILKEKNPYWLKFEFSKLYFFNKPIAD